MSNKLFSSLPLRTGITLALGSALLTVFLSFLIYNQTVTRELENANHQISQLFSTVEKSAAISAYLNNEELASEVTRGLANNDIVSGVMISSGTGMKIISGTPFNHAENDATSLLIYELASPFFAEEKAGEIVIKPNHQYINIRARQIAQSHLYTMAVHSFLLTILVIFLVHHFLTKPLVSVASALHKIEPGSSERLDCPRSHQNDEIGLLVKDTNHLLTAAQNTVIGERRFREYVESLQEQTRLEAERDPLTHLLNRRAGERALENGLQKAITEDLQFAVMLIDLDRFKPINDTYGHEAGDVVLVEISRRIEKSLRKSDTVIRWGGDEFLVLAIQGHDKLDIDTLSSKLLKTLSDPIAITDTITDNIGASIGIAVYPDHSADAETLIDLADKAMYHIKHSGRNGYFVHGADSLD